MGARWPHFLAPRRRQRGVSLTELMVGTALGLVAVASTTSLVVGQVDHTRRQAQAERLQQDLRHAADLMARELRKAGHWGAAVTASAAGSSVGAAAALNPYADFTLDAATSTVTFAISREAQDNGVLDRTDRTGFRLNRAEGTLQMLTGSGAWQTLTDPAVSRFGADGLAMHTSVTRHRLPAACPNGCEGEGCPEVAVRDVTLVLRASAVGQPLLQRELRTEVRLRNDVVTGQCPAEGA